MVFFGVKPSFREASCCKVEVVKGGAEERFFSAFFTSVTVNSFPVMSAMTALVCSSFSSSRFLGLP